MRPDDTPSDEIRRARPGSAVPMMLIYLAFVAVVVGIAVYYRFPSNYDEFEHYAVIRAQAEHPALFPDYASYYQLDRHDPSRWSTQKNYINHPSAYYLLLAPLTALRANVALIRFANVVLVAAAMAGALRAGVRLLPGGSARLFFALILLSFPKAALVGGMINNDNLALLAGALVFAGMTGGTGLLAAGLIVAGWSKLTALIALGAVVGADRIARVRRGEIGLRDPSHLRLAAATAIGALPYLVHLAQTGHLLYVNAEAFAVPPERRLHLDFVQFCGNFFHGLVDKWPASEGVLPFWLELVALLAPLALAVTGAVRGGVIGRIGATYAVGLVVMLAIHLWFGWSAFTAVGDLTIAQTRYYDVLWPGIALAAATGAARLTDRRAWLAWPIAALILLPTVPGGIAIALARG